MKKSFNHIKLLVFLVSSCIVQFANAQIARDTNAILHLSAPAIFKIKFQTTKGDFIIEVHKDWSPKAADRLYQLITFGAYNNIYVFRATAKYTQFGISDDSTMNLFWDNHPVKDEPVLQSNTDSTVSFASGGPDTRSMQIFINMQNNLKLDTTHMMGVNGFPPLGKVIEGMDVVRSFNTQYGDDIAYNYQDSIYSKGNNFLAKKFPGLDRIIAASIIEQ